MTGEETVLRDLNFDLDLDLDLDLDVSKSKLYARPLTWK
jgi:hypothetical protein